MTAVPCQRLIFYRNFCVEEAGIGLTNTGQLLFPASNLKTDWRGITGLETAIVLVAFILVATVFAFAVLSTGLVASEKSKEAALGSLKEASGTLMVRGRVVGTSNNALTALDQVKFTLSSATQANEGVEFTTAASVISYLDENQAVNLAASDWTPTWLIGSGPVVDAGEQVENRRYPFRVDPTSGQRHRFHPSGSVCRGCGGISTKVRSSRAYESGRANLGRQLVARTNE